MFSESLLAALRSAQHVAVLTGAGISAESGIPTFRSTDGLWKQFKPEELATFEAFIRNPTLVSAWYAERRKIIRNVEPNAGHRALAQLAHCVPRLSLITQNIDGLHQQAGNRHVIELHGNIHRNICIQCHRLYTQEEFPSSTMPPQCQCGGIIRPDVVWFGEMLSAEVLDAAWEAASSCDVFLSIGTSAVVYPAAFLPRMAKQYGAFVVEINVEQTDLSPFVDECLLGQAGVVLPALVVALESTREAFH